MPQPSANFYREQAQRLTFLAVEAASPETRLELLEIAASFQKLADYASGNNKSANNNATAVDEAASQSA